MAEKDEKAKGQKDLAAPAPLVEGEDYLVDARGRWVFTAAYLLKRGYCCESGCKNCPYGYRK